MPQKYRNIQQIIEKTLKNRCIPHYQYVHSQNTARLCKSSAEFIRNKKGNFYIANVLPNDTLALPIWFYWSVIRIIRVYDRAWFPKYTTALIIHARGIYKIWNNARSYGGYKKNIHDIRNEHYECGNILYACL